MKRTVIAWTLWGFALYLTAPYVPYFMNSLGNGAFYLLVSQAFGTSLIPLAYLLSKRVKPSYLASASLIAYAVGLMTVPLKSPISAFLLSAYWGAVPVYYVLMKGEKKGWALSMVPGAVLPFVGSLDPKVSAIMAGFFAAVAGVLSLGVEVRNARATERINFAGAIPILAMAMAYPVSYTAFGLSETMAGLVTSVGYAVGIMLMLYNGFSAFIASLFAFSTISLAPVNGIASWALGLSETLLAYSLDETGTNDLRSSTRLAIFESLSYMWGYAIAFLLYSTAFLIPVLAGGLTAVYAMLLILMSLLVVKTRRLVLLLRAIKTFRSLGKYSHEWVDPYFKVS